MKNIDSKYDRPICYSKIEINLIVLYSIHKILLVYGGVLWQLN